MKKRIKNWAILIVFPVIFLAGCKQGEPPIQPLILPEEAITLRISCHIHEAGLRGISYNFTQKYPNITIEINDDFGGDYFKYSEYVKTALQSGAGEDIMEISLDDYYRFGNSPHFSDLYTFMDQDTDFNKGDYYTNVFEAFAINGRLPFLPRTFNIQYMGVNSGYPEIVEGFGRLNMVSDEEMLALYYSITPEDRERDNLYFRRDYNIANVVYDPAFLDLMNGTCDYTNERFYQRAREAIALAQPNTTGLFVGARHYSKDYLETNYLFAAVSDKDRYLFLPKEDYIYLDEELLAPEGHVDFKPWDNGQGQARIIRTVTYGINGNSPNQAAAWEFMKYMINGEPLASSGYSQSDNFLYKPVDQLFIERELEKAMTPTEASLSDKLMADIHKTTEKIMANTSGPVVYEETTALMEVADICYSMHNGEITVEQGGERLENLMALYLME